MNTRLCVFKTHNQAITAFGLLKRAGIRAEIVQTPLEYKREKTCSYSISFSPELENTVRSILQKNTLEFYII